MIDLLDKFRKFNPEIFSRTICIELESFESLRISRFSRLSQNNKHHV